VVAAPKAPAWLILVLLAVSLVLSRFLCGPLVNMVAPNRDLTRNLRLARSRIEQGVVRVEPM
jgi:hypothetical protein